MTGGDDDGLMRSLPRIAHLARQDEARDSQFRVYLKTELPLSNRELDVVVHEIAERVSGAIDCTDCAHCCRTLQIVVDRKDIARLARRFGQSVASFTEQYVDQAEDGVQHIRRSPCPFLSPDGPCTVYEDRPRACRDYPYLHLPHTRSRSLILFESRGGCPIVFNVWNELRGRFERPRPPRKK